MEEKKNTEKKRKTQKQERFSLVREEDTTETLRTDDDDVIRTDVRWTRLNYRLQLLSPLRDLIKLYLLIIL